MCSEQSVTRPAVLVGIFAYSWYLEFSLRENELFIGSLLNIGNDKNVLAKVLVSVVYFSHVIKCAWRGSFNSH